MNWQYKQRALRALKGNWQTALVVSFCAGIIITGSGLVQLNVRVDPSATSYDALVNSIQSSLRAVPMGTWVLLGLLRILHIFLSPALELGSCHYFVRRLQGEEIGFQGLFSRFQIWGKAFLLSILMALKIFAWSLLFIIPGYIAAIRYSMATYFLAEDPSLSVTEAIEKSKEAMKGRKLNYVSLSLSFLGWAVLSLMVQYFLADVNAILSLVIYQFLSLALTTYVNGSFAAFYLNVSGADTYPKMAEDDSTPQDAGDPYK